MSKQGAQKLIFFFVVHWKVVHILKDDALPSISSQLALVTQRAKR